MKSCHALNEGPQNSQTHCSGLVELSCLARHGKSAKEERLLLAKGCEDLLKGKAASCTLPTPIPIARLRQAAGIPRSARI